MIFYKHKKQKDIGFYYDGKIEKGKIIYVDFFNLHSLRVAKIPIASAYIGVMKIKLDKPESHDVITIVTSNKEELTKDSSCAKIKEP